MVESLKFGLDEAFRLTLERTVPIETEEVDLSESVDRIVSESLRARVDSPSVDASLKDGYAVLSGDVADATPRTPVRLRLLGHMAAGGDENIRVLPGGAVRVLTGARIPAGADAVVAEEFVIVEEGIVQIRNHAEPGRNILPKGCDVAKGRLVVDKGHRLTPGMLGILAAAGHSRLPVVRRPRVAIVATGDEVVAPGLPLPEGKLYASNMTTLSAWCRRYGMRTRLEIVRDEADAIHETLKSCMAAVDAVITSGGAWTGDRDLVAQMLDRLGWEQVFHRIRIGPGKAVGFGLLYEKPVFILPGGPPSNLMGFLQIALPGLMKLSGCVAPGLPRTRMRLSSDLNSGYADWTQFVFGTIQGHNDVPVFKPLRGESRLRSMAEAEAVVAIPEGLTHLSAGSVVSAQLLT
ncbi:MAG: gephyrin-like molybdotransferase Glp [Desulfobacterales bacterium]